MAQKDAEVVIGADASAVERAAATAIDAWRGAGSSITGALAGVGRSLADIALNASKVNFSSQHEQVKQFENASAHLAIAMGRDLESVRASMEATGIAIGKRPAEVAAWEHAVGRLTYNFGAAGEAIKGMSALAAQTGRSVEDYQGLAAVMGTVGKVTGDTSHAVGVLNAQAQALGTAGGIAAFSDQVEALGDTISHFAGQSERDFLRVTAVAAALGQGLSPQASGRVQQQALGALSGDPLRWERFLGKSITDEHGEIRNDKDMNPATIMRDITEKVKRRYGHDAKRVLQLNFGAETGAALFNADYGKAVKAAGLAPSGAAEDAMHALGGTDAQKRAVDESQLAASSRALMGSSTALGRAADALQHFAAHNPLLSTLGGTVAGSVVSSVIGKGVGMLGGAAGSGGLGSLIGGAGGFGSLGGLGMAALPWLGAGAAVAGGAYLGGKAGMWIDEKTGWTDKAFGTGKR